MRAVDLSDVENATDVWVRDLARGADFAEESFVRRLVFSEMFGQKLQRDRLIQFEVFGFIDFAHPASAQ